VKKWARNVHGKTTMYMQ